jgi:hypothetical protein
MKPSWLTSLLRRHRFHNQELVYQSLYKAQNLGFYQNIYEDGLIERYTETVTKADTYASAGSFKRARRTLGPAGRPWEATGLRAAGAMRVTLAVPSNLAALALVAEVHAMGWSLVIEDCPFTQRFVQPVARREGRRTTFHPFSLIPRQIRRDAAVGNPRCRVYVTFPDRPFDSIKGSITVRLLGQDYLLSIAEALLARAAVDHVFSLARSLVAVEHPPGGASTIRGEDLRELVQEQAAALETAILDAPLDYLGWESLYSRSRMYFELVRANQRSFFACLLRHCQLNGMPLNQAAYAGLVEQLARRDLRP